MYKMNDEEISDIHWVLGEETGNEVILFVQEDLEGVRGATDFYELLSTELSNGVYVMNRKQREISGFTLDDFDEMDLPPQFNPSNGNWNEFVTDDPKYSFFYWMPRKLFAKVREEKFPEEK